MAIYLKEIEAYRLGDGEQPQWLKDAIKIKEVVFNKQTMIDGETLKKVENAITGIRI